MPVFTCNKCKISFKSRSTKRKYCSLQCFYSTPISEKTRDKLRKYHKENPVKFWLGKTNPHTLGKNNIHWNGGKTSREGYKYILSQEHPHHNNENYVKEHRLVAEKILGRYLSPKEVIHHINFKRSDNRPENLYLFKSNKEHSQYHGYTNPPKLISNLV